MTDTSCIFDNIIIVKAGLNILPQELLPNTFYYLEAGEYITEYSIHAPSCSIVVGENDKVNFYAAKLGGIDSIFNIVDKMATTHDVLLKNINIIGNTDGERVFEMCDIG